MGYLTLVMGAIEIGADRHYLELSSPSSTLAREFKGQSEL